jgi:hypothetical protein
MVEETRPRNLLLIAATQSLSPLPRRIPSTFSLHDALHLHHRQDLQQVRVYYSACTVTVNIGVYETD